MVTVADPGLFGAIDGVDGFTIDSLRRPDATPAKALKAAFPPDLAEEKLADAKAWSRLRRKALKPLRMTKPVTTEQHRLEFLEGARLLRFFGSTATPGKTPQPQQLLIADVLAAGHKRNALLVPRRSSKSTTLIAVGLGRAAHREDYRVGILTLTSGKAGRSRFLKDVAPPIERLYRDKSERPMKVVRIAGMEGITFPSGGSVNWLSTLDDVRGEAFDLLILDEAGEPNDPNEVREIIGAALPTLDTRPDAQLVIVGTAGTYRTGNLLWEALELGRGGVGSILEYAMPEKTTDEELAAWEPTEDAPEGHVRELVEMSHPGVGTLTTLQTIRENYQSMPVSSFAREYGSIFGELGTTAGIFDVEQWAKAGSGANLPTPPERFALAFAPHPDQLCVSIIAAWRNEDGKSVPLLLEHKRGIDWAALALLRLSRKYGVPIVYDTGNQVALLIVEQLNRARPRPKLEPKTFIDVKKAASLIVDDVERDNVEHFRQPELDSAAKLTMKRKIGVNGWAFGRDPKQPGDDITPIEGWALAQLAYDLTKPKRKSTSRVVA